MTIILTIFVFLFIFSFLVLIHEFGHYYAARRAGIKVVEFGFGLPPRMWGVKKGDMLFSINWIPFGGFVRLLGEDSHDPKMLKNKGSFISKPARVRVMVIVAGVLMNFLLAILLLTVGFIFGIQPLILGGDDVLANLKNGTIETVPGIVVKDVVKGGPAELAGLQMGDRLLLMDGKEIVAADTLQTTVKEAKGKSVVFSVERGTMETMVQITPQSQPGLGFETYELLYLPRLKIQSVRPGSASDKAGLKAGDILLAANDAPLYFSDDYDAVLHGATEVHYMVQRGTTIFNVLVDFPQKSLVVVSSVFSGSSAEQAGLKEGDMLISLDGEVVKSPATSVAYTKTKAGKSVMYQLIRNGQPLSLAVTPSGEGLIGVGLSSVSSFENTDVSLYNTDVATSVSKINDVRYPFWIAPIRALEESGRLSVMTVEMFANVIRSIVTRFSVPEGVAGPVGIAQLTYVFVQQGALPLVRFMALLSLSLAIINVLPLPALDGGRLLFIVLEVLIGRKVGQKFEAYVHAIGFLLLMVLIVMVTYSDIARIFF